MWLIILVGACDQPARHPATHPPAVAGSPAAGAASAAAGTGSPAPVAAGTSSPAPVAVAGAAAQSVDTVRAFIDAVNAGRLDAALALVSDDPVYSDCDRRQVKAVSGKGVAAFAGWLRERIADHDELDVAHWETGIEGDVLGVGVVFARRASDSLASLGFAVGIVPQLGTKVILERRAGAVRIAQFANGPVGGDPAFCRPVP